jgi:lipopolysaccharide/colanic/teichoic acid biosynthesis glycosyltransferase
MKRSGFDSEREQRDMAIDANAYRADGAATAALAAHGETLAASEAAPHVGGPTSDLIDALPGYAYRIAKRGFDIVVSVFGLIGFGLIFPLLALIIKLDSPGPVFYSQERVGLNRRRRGQNRDGSERRKVLQPGRPFRIHKLRTMRSDAEAAGPQWAKQGDARITRVGRFLRKTRLDELPQFWNVLKGDMSFIGPRPERLCFIRKLEHEVPHYHDRLLVKPGLTGLAQVRNGYDDSVESVRRKVELDRQYIQRCGPLTEAGILVETVRVVLKGEGAH